MTDKTVAQTKSDKNKMLRRRLLAAAVTVVTLAAALNGIPVPQGDGPVSRVAAGVLTQVFNLGATSKAERVAAVVGDVVGIARDLRETMDQRKAEKTAAVIHKPSASGLKV